MRILILTKKVPYPTHDGESIAIMQLASKFSNMGNEVHMLCMQTNKHNFKINEIPQDILKSITISAVFVQNNISYIDIIKNLFKQIPYQFERFYQEEFMKKLKIILEQFNFDVIQLEGFFLVPYISEIRKKSNAKIILRSHNIEHRIWKSYAKNESHLVKKIFLLYQENKMCKYEKMYSNTLDAIIPISLSDAAWYRQNTTVKKIKYVPCGLDSNYSLQNNNISTGKFYFIGALDWLPNIQGITWFIEKVLPYITNKIPDFKLHVAGRNASSKLLSVFQDPILFYGEVANASTFIQDKEFCIVPLLSGSGMKIKIVEAMMNKKIVITTSVGIEGLPDGIHDVVYLAETPKDFANKIIQCLENKPEVLLKKENAFYFAKKHFEANELAMSLLEYYKKL